MKLVLDANVVVAAFASLGLCEAVFELCLDSHQLLVSEELLGEIYRNLREKIGLPESTAGQIDGLLRDTCEVLTPLPAVTDACRAPDDLHVIGLAAAGNADFLITGDNDLLILKNIGRCRILTPRQFADFIHKS